MLWIPIDNIKDIPADKYEISEDGHIRNKYWIGIRDDITVPTSIQENSGYVIALLSDSRPNVRRRGVNNRLHNVLVWVSRLVAIAFVPIPDGFDEKDLTVFHINGDKADNHYQNLEWRIGSFKIEDRRRMLEIIKEHYDHFNNHDIAKMIQKELGFHVAETTVASVLQRDRHGNPKSKHWRLFGIDPSFFTNKPLKKSDELITFICRTLCKFNGDTKKTRKYLSDLGVDADSKLINSICKKYTYVKISDRYFDYNDWDGFKSKI